MTTNNSEGGTRTVHRTATLLRAIAANSRAGMRLVDLHRGTGMERPTVHRLLQSLVAEKLVRQDSRTRRYFLGQGLYELGLAAIPKAALRDLAHPFLSRLAEFTEETVFLTERSDLDGVCIDRVEGRFPVKVFVLDVARRRPLTVGGGSLAILSALTDDEIDCILLANRDRTQQGFPRYSEQGLREHIHLARRQGYALKTVLEVPDIQTVAMPVRAPEGRPVAAVSLAALASRLTPDRLGRVTTCMAEVVSGIEEALVAQARQHG
jgi:DNA-binding IclR family transcriptional regulator